jgi:hypothetical protein
VFPLRHAGGDPRHFRHKVPFAFVSPHTYPEDTAPFLQFEDDDLKPPSRLHARLPTDVHPFDF